MKALHLFAVAGALTAGLIGCEHYLEPGRAPAGTIYTLSNEVSGNRVIRYIRWGDGRLQPHGAFATGGKGTSSGLGSQGALIISSNHRWLFAVNAGSNDISVLQLNHAGGLKFHSRVSSGGTRPVSLTQHGSWLYVLHAGGQSNITGFWISPGGQLSPIPNSTRFLSSPAAAPAQVQFSQDGRSLIVTEKATNLISSFPVDAQGLPGSLKTHPAAGQTPFGFALGRGNHFYVSEAAGGATNQSSLSAYAIDAAGNITTLDGPEPTHQTAACWVAATRHGWVYTTNAGSGSVSGFRASHTGDLTLLHADGISVLTGAESSPTDVALSHNGRFLYVLEAGTRSVSAYRIGPDGSLSQIDEDAGLPPGAVGLAAW